ncbi:MAG: M20 family metallo-hydrolase [Candidatus Solibacter sp.]
MKLYIDTDHIVSELDELAGFSDAPAPAVTRIVFSPADLQARAWLKEKCAAAGLGVREDAVGNCFARWAGTDPSLPAVASGSHIDAIPHSGRFDGTVGVVGMLEAMRALQAAGFRPRRSIELIHFTSEEPTRFGLGCLGSRLLSGSLAAERAAALKDTHGATLDEVREAAGFTGGLESVALPPNRYHAFVELHIEQGPLLERTQVPLGVVTAIAAPATLDIAVQGEGGHAGGVLMPYRRDALAAAAEIVLAVEAAAKSTGAIDTVGTVGICEVFPGAVNSVPSQVRITADVRDVQLERRNAVLAAIGERCQAVAASRRVTVTCDVLNADAPAECSVLVMGALEAACRELEVAYRSMVSRAYHDSLFMARIAPTAMLFIPCRDGVSHRPDEFATPEDIARGTLVLAHALARLAG